MHDSKPCARCGAPFEPGAKGQALSWCKPCRRAYMRQYMQRRYRQNIHNKASCIRCRRLVDSSTECEACSDVPIDRFISRRHCVHCGDAYTPKHGLQRYCSKPCQHRAAYERKMAREHRTCRWCFKSYDSLVASPVLVCSGECAAQQRAHAHTWKNGDRCYLPMCIDCGEPTLLPPGQFPGQNRCLACLERFDGRRAVAKLLGDNVHWSDIVDRDNWTCHICGQKVPKNVQLNHPKAPTVDHLIPIAHGGTDTYDNTALAHRECNTSRGTGGVAQLRIVG